MNKKYIVLAGLIIMIAVVAIVIASRWNKHTIVIKDYWPDAGQPVVRDSSVPSGEKLTADENAIRQFMGMPNLPLTYITSQKNPSNFTVGKVETIPVTGKNESSAWKMDTPKEWERPVNVYQQTGYINDRCEIYEYEVDARNNQLVEAHVKYPQEIQNMQTGSPTDLASKCKQYGSMETPIKTKSQIEQEAFKYLGVYNSDILLRSDIQLEYIPSTKNPINAPAANEWKWQDKSYKLPEGLSAEDNPYPTVRIIMTSGGKLLYYFNSRNLFQN